MAGSISFVSEKLKAVLAQLPYLPRALALVWRATKKLTIIWFILLLIQGILPVATVYLTRALVDSLVFAVGGGGAWETVQTPLLLALLMAAIMLLTRVLQAAVRWVRTAQSDLVRDYMQGLVHDRAIKADLAYYETPEYHDQMHRARVDSQGRPMALVESLGGLIQNCLTLLAMSAVLLPYGWWVPLALLSSTLPALWVVIRFAILQYDWRMRNTETERRAWYLDWLLTNRENAPEIRLFDLGESFSDNFQNIRRKLRKERLALLRSEAITEMMAGGFALVIMAAALVWMVIQAIHGAMTLGDLAMFYQAFNQGQKLMHSLLSTVGQIYSNSLFLENLFEFLGLEPTIVDPEYPKNLPAVDAPSLSLRGVAFQYPGAKRSVFKNLDLEIPAGKVVALLGVNGAGKSTLFKLLCRLYDPTSGSIELEGTDIRNFEITKLRSWITVLFQEPVRYCETVATNIGFGDRRRDHEIHSLKRAIESAGASEIVERLPDGINNLLGKWFEGGAELSVGEWQRIALARACLRDAKIVLLDEPTSAMDSWAEADWVHRFRLIAKGRTSIIITHRLTTAKSADLIHVIDNGVVIESGTHDELVQKGGAYAESWTRQTEN